MGTLSQHRRSRVLLVLCVAAFMASLDLFIVNVAFEDIARDFEGTRIAELSWVLNGYAIVYAALLVPAGRLADRFGRKAGFLLGLAVFTLASAGCALSTSLWPLVAFRVMQAAGAAALTPASLGLLISVFPADGRARAVRIWAASGALAAAAGPVLGGVLVELSWRWVFVLNVPVGIAALVVAGRIVTDSRDPAVARVPDLLGAALLALGIGALALALVKGGDWGRGSASTLAALAVAAAAVGWFARRTASHPLPVVEPALLRVRTFAWANLACILFSAAFAANLLLCVLWLQRAWGWSALETGLGVAPGPLMVPVFAAVADRLRRRVGAGAVTAAGCALFALGTVVVLTSVGPESAYASEVLPGWLIGGAGVGLALPEILASSTTALPEHRAATGSAIVNMSRQLGAVLGISVAVALLGEPATLAQALSSFEAAWWASAAVASAGAVAALGMTSRPLAVPAAARASA